MKIAFFEVKEQDKEFFSKKFAKDTELIFFDAPLREDKLESIQDVEGLVIFIYSPITQLVLNKLKKLQFIATMSTGFDHIDIATCKKRSIIVCNVPAYAEVTVAEHTFALLLAISRRLTDSFKRIKEEGKFSPEGLTGFDLYDKTLGVIGVGAIGKNVIKIARGFGMNVVAFTHSPNKSLEKKLGFSFVELDELLKKSDIISLHIPHNPESHHFLNDERFKKMKDGVVIINTARGGIIDTHALLESLKSGKVSYVGLDVLEEEPLLHEEHALLSKYYKKEQLEGILESHLLLSHPNVIVTPHNAFNSQEALEKILAITAENISGFLGGSPVNTVK